MIDPADRYRTLIDATLRAALTDRLARPLPDGLAMDLSLPAIAARLGMPVDGRLAEVVARISAAAPDTRVVDGMGQTRSTYRPLLWRAAAPFVSDKTWASHAEAEALRFANRRGQPTVADGADVAGSVFDALACVSADVDSSVARAAFARLAAMQGADGKFLARTSADQLEPAWYHELAVLHAVDSYARKTGDAAAREAVKRSARYHAEQVQPDHASSHPFGLAALLEDAEGIFLADMMLHAAGCQQPATMDAVSLVLLFDAIDGR
jgi:hypothetical protein